MTKTKPHPKVKMLLESMSPEELASKMHVSVSTVFRWKAGTTKPHRHLEMTLGELGKNSPKAKVR